MGAALACRALPRLAQFRAAALVAPSDSVEGEISAAEMLGYRIGNALNVGASKLGARPMRVPYKFRYEDLYVDPEAAARARKAGFLATHVSLANYAALLSVQGARWARDVKAPTLVVLCTRDTAVKPTSSRRVYEGLAGPKRLVEIESGHSAFGDVRAEELSFVLDGWFRESLGA